VRDGYVLPPEKVNIYAIELSTSFAFHHCPFIVKQNNILQLKAEYKKYLGTYTGLPGFPLSQDDPEIEAPTPTDGPADGGENHPSKRLKLPRTRGPRRTSLQRNLLNPSLLQCTEKKGRSSISQIPVNFFSCDFCLAPL
jgi:hypothetical protein